MQRVCRLSLPETPQSPSATAPPSGEPVTKHPCLPCKRKCPQCGRWGSSKAPSRLNVWRLGARFVRRQPAEPGPARRRPWPLQFMAANGRREDARQQPAVGPADPESRRIRGLQSMVPEFVNRTRGSNRPSALPAYSSMRPLKAMVRVTSSVYSSSAPTGMPRAMRVTFTPRGLISRAR